MSKVLSDTDPREVALESEYPQGVGEQDYWQCRECGTAIRTEDEFLPEETIPSSIENVADMAHWYAGRLDARMQAAVDEYARIFDALESARWSGRDREFTPVEQAAVDEAPVIGRRHAIELTRLAWCVSNMIADDETDFTDVPVEDHFYDRMPELRLIADFFVCLMGVTQVDDLRGFQLPPIEERDVVDLGLTRFRGLLSLGAMPLERSLDAASASTGVSG